MRNKSKLAIAISLLLLAGSFAIPASAATKIKAGASCSKANSTTKISGDSYVCTKNPLVKNAKLTWVWTGCITANKQYTESVARLATLKSGLVDAQAKIDQLKAEVPADEAKAKEFDAKAADAKAKQDKALAEAATNAAKVTQYGASSDAGRAYKKNVDLWTKNASTYELAVKNFQRAAAALRDKATQIEREQKKLDLSNQSITSATVQIKSNDDTRKQACAVGL